MIRIRHVQYGEFSAEVVTRPDHFLAVSVRWQLRARLTARGRRPGLTTPSCNACMHGQPRVSGSTSHRIASRIARNSTTRLHSARCGLFCRAFSSSIGLEKEVMKVANPSPRHLGWGERGNWVMDGVRIQFKKITHYTLMATPFAFAFGLATTKYVVPK